MKSISGSIISSKPISLSKAASALTLFLSTETGASQAVSAYLKRASTSFNELVQFHRELKARRSERKHERTRSVDDRSLTSAERNHREGEPTQIRGQDHDLGEEGLGHPVDVKGGDFNEGRKSGKKKKRDFVDDKEGGGGSIVGEDEKNRKRKKRKNSNIEEVVNDQNNLSQHRKKKRKHKGQE